MKRALGLLSLLFLASTIIVALTSVGARPEQALPAPEAVTDDAGAAVVAAFYRALLQEEAPTAEQDEILFHSPGDWRDILVDRKALREDNPVLLDWFRERKAQFLPKDLRSPADIRISTTFNIARSVDELFERQEPGHGFVRVLFDDDRSGQSRDRFRLVHFTIWDNKIKPESIKYGGSFGRRTLEDFHRGAEKSRKGIAP